jgi:apolipoprotein D and lipocalin family protein
MVKKKTVLVAASLTLLAAAAIAVRPAAKRELDVVPSIDLSRYAGQWYEIARLPNRFQKQCTGDVTANYALRSDGKIDVVNRCRKSNGDITQASGLARRASQKKPNSILEVRFAPSYLSFLPFVWGDYQVIALAEDYTHALVGTSDRKYLWILSRAPFIDKNIYQQLLIKAKEQGFDASRFQRTQHSGV